MKKAIMLLLMGVLITPLFSQEEVKMPLTASTPTSKLMQDQKMKLTKGTQTILVPRFAINFVTKNDFSNSTGPYSGKLKATVALTLLGLSESDYQEITDQAYAYYVQRLEAEGFKVLGLEDLKNNKLYGKLKLIDWAMHEEGQVKLTSVAGALTAASHLVTYTAIGQENFLPLGTGPLVKMGTNNFLTYGKIAKELDATLTEIEFIMDFSTASREKRYSTSSTEISVQAQPSIYPSYFRTIFLMPNMKMAFLTTKEKALIDDASFVKTTSPTSERWDGTRKGSSFFQVEVEVEKYKEIMLKEIQIYLDKIVQELKAAQ